MNIIKLLIHSVKLLFKRVCANFHCHIQCIRAMLSVFKNTIYTQYRTKTLVYIMKIHTVFFSRESRKIPNSGNNCLGHISETILQGQFERLLLY